MGDDLPDQARDASVDLAERFVSMLGSSASTVPEQRLAPLMRAYRDTVPKVGAPAKANPNVSGGARFYQLFYGTEFGAGQYPQFRRPSDGFWFYETLRDEGRDLATDWFDQIGDLLEDEWERGARSV